jgi:hypothetical protein
MRRLCEVSGNVVAILGALVCAGSFAARLGGHYRLFGSDIVTIFLGGIALMVMASLLKIHALAPTKGV